MRIKCEYKIPILLLESSSENRKPIRASSSHCLALLISHLFITYLDICRTAFRDELALLQKIRHPNVVQFLGAVTQSSPMMIVTEYLPKVVPSSLSCFFLIKNGVYGYVSQHFT